jgi:hypothetical protein
MGSLLWHGPGPLYPGEYCAVCARVRRRLSSHVSAQSSVHAVAVVARSGWPARGSQHLGRPGHRWSECRDSHAESEPFGADAYTDMDQAGWSLCMGSRSGPPLNHLECPTKAGSCSDSLCLATPLELVLCVGFPERRRDRGCIYHR